MTKMKDRETSSFTAKGFVEAGSVRIGNNYYANINGIIQVDEDTDELAALFHLYHILQVRLLDKLTKIPEDEQSD